MPTSINLTPAKRRILLASSSPYRATLLQQLGIEFSQAAPDINEARLDNESPENMVARLTEQKAWALTAKYPNHTIIASDQIALTQRGEILGKPKTEANAINQLLSVSGEKLSFLTGLCVLTPLDEAGEWKQQSTIEPFQVYFRNLSRKQISNYVKREQPLDCAGSFKVEGMGISLFEKLEGDDPNALVGLPLIKLCSFLEIAGLPVLG